jgi:predicted RNA-binding Zn-ribbon protein involved in translation (DUF1610 family)
MFEYRCKSCGVQAYSSASYATAGRCPSCGQELEEDAYARVPEPEPVSAAARITAAGGRSASAGETCSDQGES